MEQIHQFLVWFDEQLRRRSIKPFIKIIILLSSGFVFYQLYQNIVVSPGEELRSRREVFLLFCSIVFAFYTWLVTSWVSAKLALRQHTVNVLLNYSHSSVYHEHRRLFLSEFGTRTLETVDWADGKVLQWDDDGCKKEVKVTTILNSLLNEYEFISAGILCGDLDELLLRKTIRGQLTRLIRQCANYIRESRGEDSNGKVAHPLMFENLLALQGIWAKYDK